MQQYTHTVSGTGWGRLNTWSERTKKRKSEENPTFYCFCLSALQMIDDHSDPALFPRFGCSSPTLQGNIYYNSWLLSNQPVEHRIYTTVVLQETRPEPATSNNHTPPPHPQSFLFARKSMHTFTNKRSKQASRGYNTVRVMIFFNSSRMVTWSIRYTKCFLSHFHNVHNTRLPVGERTLLYKDCTLGSVKSV